MSKKAILVTGSHRSGSTWVGKMIAQCPSVVYIHEPFNLEIGPGVGICSAKFNYWFTYISPENESQVYRAIANTIKFKFNVLEALQAAKSRQEAIKALQDYKRFWKYRLYHYRPLLKDPIALFSAEWLASRFNLDMVVLIRHPAAFAGSLKVKNWTFPFSHFLEQPLLMKDHLSPFAEEIKAYAQKEYDIIDQASLLWKLIHYMIYNYREKHPDWLFLRHEDISKNPISSFENIFKYLNLDFSEKVEKSIKEYSKLEKNDRANLNKDLHLKRDSQSNIWNWQTRLTPSEISRIKKQVEDISRQFYSDEEWGIEDHEAKMSYQ
jgi:hypothetical protein